MLRALLFVPFIAVPGCDPPPVDATIEVSGTRGGVAVSEQVKSTYAVLKGCGPEQSLYLTEAMDDRSYTGPRLVAWLEMNGDGVLIRYLNTRDGQLGSDSGLERYFTGGEGTVTRGPLDGNWQDLVIEARAWGDRRDPDNTRDGPEDIEDFAMRIEGRFYRIKEKEPYELIKRCP